MGKTRKFVNAHGLIEKFHDDANKLQDAGLIDIVDTKYGAVKSRVTPKGLKWLLHMATQRGDLKIAEECRAYARSVGWDLT